jgi:phytanoyl-CoA hydroxylase
MSIQDSHRKFYNEQGYLVVENFLPHQTCDELVEEADRAAAGTYTNLLNLHDRSEKFYSLLTNREILAIADSLIESRMIPVSSIFFFCKPGNPLEQGSHFHQDNYAPKAPYGSYLTCGVALEDASPENGSIVVFPGTHKLGDLPCIPSKNFEQDEAGRIQKAYPIGNEVQVPPDARKIQLTYPKGSLVLIHGHTIHGAPANPSTTRWRRKIYLNYIKDGSPFWPGWVAKRRLIERDGAFAPMT